VSRAAPHASWNVNGLKRKLGDEDFINCLKSYYIVFLSETWISNDINLNLDISGFKSEHLFGKKTKGKKSGRCIVEVFYFIIRPFLINLISIIDKNKNSIMWIEIDKNVFSHNTDVYICHAYRKPTATTCFRFKKDILRFLRAVGI